MNLSEITTPGSNAAIETAAILEKFYDLEHRLTAVTEQRDTAWATIAAIRKDFVDDESIGKTVETLFAEPLVEAERKLTAARETLREVYESSSSTKLVRIAREVLKQTAPNS